MAKKIKKLSNPILYLWPLVLLKKEYILILSIIFILFNLKRKIRFDKISITMISIGCIQLFSIFIATCLNVIESQRIFAGINTSLMWVIAGILIPIFSEKKYSVDKCGLAALLNILILLALILLAVICYNLNIQVTIFGRSLYNPDYSTTGLPFRCNCFFEYTTLISYFVIINFLFAFRYIYKKGNLIKFALYVIGFICIFFSKSRWGLLLYLLIIFFCIYKTIFVNFLARKKEYMVFIKLALIIMILLISPYIIQSLVNSFNSRSDSNGMRFLIYKESIQTTIKNNILIGCGVKNMIGEYPLGSHSSIVGSFYKTGLIGFILFLYVYISLIVAAIKKYKENFIFSITLLSILLFMIFEDIDGTNWVMICFAFLISIITPKNNIKNEE